jgi:choline-phosphate cytidylyltransferase
VSNVFCRSHVAAADTSRIVRDYDKYISRQLQRGTSRQELNISWLKKNELELKRTVGELRDNIRTNWLTTGQELGKDFRQLLQSSRPASPAPGRSRDSSQAHGGQSALTSPTTLTSPTALSHLSHLELPTSTPPANGTGSQQRDFATGYALGLVGGVRNWVMPPTGRSPSKRT